MLSRRMADIGPLALKCPHKPRTSPAQPPAQAPWEAGWGIGRLGILSQPFFMTPWRSTAGRGSTTGKAEAEETLTLSWTMLFEMSAEVRMTFPEPSKSMTIAERCLHSHGCYYLKSSAKACMTHSRTIKIYDYS
jgi:hypothetical protein